MHQHDPLYNYKHPNSLKTMTHHYETRSGRQTKTSKLYIMSQYCNCYYLEEKRMIYQKDTIKSKQYKTM